MLLQSVLAFRPGIPSWHSVPVFCSGIPSWQKSLRSRQKSLRSWQKSLRSRQFCNLPVLRPVTAFRLSNKKMIVRQKCQSIDCQLSLTLSRTRRGIQNPATCAVVRFNVLIVRVIADVIAQSDLEEMPAVSMSAFPFGSPGAILGSPGRFG